MVDADLSTIFPILASDIFGWVASSVSSSWKFIGLIVFMGWIVVH